MKHLVILLSLGWSVVAVYAQEDTTITRTNAAEEGRYISEALDSLAELYFYKQGKTIGERPESPFGFNLDDVPTYPDSILAARIASIPSPMPLEYNDIVAPFIGLYNQRRREQVNRMLGMKEIYFPIFEEALDRHGIPMELKYLAVIESALNTHAVSRRGATGLWQFMYNTGRLYGLKINSYIDERRDPVKATDAACRYLKDMYGMYGDWFLVIAAYNSGPGNVNKAIRRSGGKTTFWEIRRWLPRETRGYVPAFIAATYIMTYAEEHNFYAVKPDVDLAMIDTVHIGKQTTISKVAKYTGMEADEVAWLNPALKKDVIPALKVPYPLQLPVMRLAAFDAARDSIFYNAPESVQATTASATITKYTPPSRTRSYSYEPDPDQEVLYYTVKSGDNIGYIAEWYNVSAQSIRNANNIYGSRIRVGQKLKIYVRRNVANKYRNVNRMSFEAKQELAGYKPKPTVSTSAPRSGKYLYHTVRSGDTLWDIVKLYPGNSVEGIKRLNGINNTKKLKPGMVLKVAKSG